MARKARLSIADLIIRLGLSGTLDALDRLRRQLRRRLGPIRNQPPFVLERAIRDVLLDFEPELAGLLRDTRILSWVAAVDDVIVSAPAELLEPALGRRRPEAPVTGRQLLFGDEEPFVTLPKVEQAAESLFERRVLRKADFDRLRSEERATAFTIAGQDRVETLERANEMLGELVAEGPSLRRFNERLDEILEEGDSPMSPWHREVVYRASVQNSYKEGTDRIMSDPVVAATLPYVLDASIADARRTTVCDWFAVNGASGTAVYRSDDPLYQRYSPPRHFGCRTGRVFLSAQDAAGRGVREAEQAILTGRPPDNPHRMPDPPPEIVRQMWF